MSLPAAGNLLEALQDPALEDGNGGELERSGSEGPALR